MKQNARLLTCHKSVKTNNCPPASSNFMDEKIFAKNPVIKNSAYDLNLSSSFQCSAN